MSLGSMWRRLFRLEADAAAEAAENGGAADAVAAEVARMRRELLADDDKTEQACRAYEGLEGFHWWTEDKGDQP